MTRKDYIVIAEAAKTARAGEGDTSKLDIFLSELCRILKRDNPNFDRDRFLAACK